MPNATQLLSSNHSGEVKVTDQWVTLKYKHIAATINTWKKITQQKQPGSESPQEEKKIFFFKCWIASGGSSPRIRTWILAFTTHYPCASEELPIALTWPATREPTIRIFISTTPVPVKSYPLHCTDLVSNKGDHYQDINIHYPCASEGLPIALTWPATRETTIRILPLCQ